MTPRSTGPLGAFTRPDALSGLTLFLVAAFAWIAARELPFGTLHQPGPGFFPRSLAVLTGGLAAILMARGARGKAQDVRALWPDRPGTARVVGMLAVLVGYLVALEPVGYLLTTAGLFLVLLRWVGRQSWPVTVSVALLSAAGSYVLFARWLMVSLPAGLWAP
jgi:putative tricarboxylic transport membrane protein